MSERTPSDSADREQVRVFRVAAGTSATLRVLSPTYGGLFTHWKGSSEKGRGIYCAGESCPPVMHKTPRTWHGYAACQLYLVESKRWRPIVFELSEHAELDVRGFWRRGQVWRFDRPASKEKKHGAVRAKLLGNFPENAVPEPFDYRAVLFHVFHVEQLDLGCNNPLPPRVLMSCEDANQDGYQLIEQLDPVRLRADAVHPFPRPQAPNGHANGQSMPY